MSRSGDTEISELGRSLTAQNAIPTYLDIGAAGGLRAAWKEAADRGLVVPVLADFDQSAADHLPYVFGSENRRRDFFITAMPGCSSCLEPVQDDWLRQCPLGYYFEVVEVIQVQEVRADRLIECGRMPRPELVKLDVQGYEAECLRGFGRYLDSVLAIELESHLKTLYRGQTLFPEMVEYLAGEGFVLRHMEPDGDWGDGEIVEIDAFFSRRRSNLAADSEKLLHLDLWETVLEIPTPEPHVRKDLKEEMRKGVLEGFLPQPIGTDRGSR